MQKKRKKIHWQAHSAFPDWRSAFERDWRANTSYKVEPVVQGLGGGGGDCVEERCVCVCVGVGTRWTFGLDERRRIAVI